MRSGGPGAAARIPSIDLLRGTAMVIMVLDHVRMFLHNESLRISPTNLEEASAGLFLTRWITHPAAPVFVFLAGTAAYLQILSGKTEKEVSLMLALRGLWLIVLELTVVRLSLTFNLDYADYFGSLQVIWAIGCSMIILAVLLFLPLPLVGLFAVAVIAGHHLLDGIKVTSWRGPLASDPSILDSVWLILHQPGSFLLCHYPCPRVRVTYPLIPWFAVMAAGYATGYVYRRDRKERRFFLLALGAFLAAAFLTLRLGNVYGDPRPWIPMDEPLFTLFSFLNVTKYPVSLLFLLMTLGPCLCLLAWWEGRRNGPLSRVMITFGRVPLFFYLLQFFVAHGLAVLLGLIAGQSVDHLFRLPPGKPSGVGFDLWLVYLVWLFVLALLYPLCRWYGKIRKAHRGQWWTGYL